MDVKCQKKNKVKLSYIEESCLARLCNVLNGVVCCLATRVDNLVTVARTNCLRLLVLQASDDNGLMFCVSLVDW